jgi:hypothetical protein
MIQYIGMNTPFKLRIGMICKKGLIFISVHHKINFDCFTQNDEDMKFLEEKCKPGCLNLFEEDYNIIQDKVKKYEVMKHSNSDSYLVQELKHFSEVTTVKNYKNVSLTSIEEIDSPYTSQKTTSIFNRIGKTQAQFQMTKREKMGYIF